MSHVEFQFALPRGERRVIKLKPDAVVSFNSRSRVGSDLPGFLRVWGVLSFNSRSRVGSDSTDAAHR